MTVERRNGGGGVQLCGDNVKLTTWAFYPTAEEKNPAWNQMPSLFNKRLVQGTVTLNGYAEKLLNIWGSSVLSHWTVKHRGPSVLCSQSKWWWAWTASVWGAVGLFHALHYGNASLRGALAAHVHTQGWSVCFCTCGGPCDISGCFSLSWQEKLMDRFLSVGRQQHVSVTGVSRGRSMEKLLGF